MASVTVMPQREWTADDLDGLPDDGLRYELVDGVLLVSAAPNTTHQLALANLFFLLMQAAPPGLRVLPAPTDVRFSPRRQLQPDLCVVQRSAIGGARIEVPPLLAVEVLSPSTRTVDRTVKRSVFEDGGVPAYWLVDPLRPSLTVLELVGGAYLERATVLDEEPYDAVLPFPVRVVPSALLV